MDIDRDVNVDVNVDVDVPTGLMLMLMLILFCLTGWDINGVCYPLINGATIDQLREREKGAQLTYNN